MDVHSQAQALKRNKPKSSVHASQESLRLCLFGTFELRRADTSITLSTRKTQALFAYIALYPEAHSREKLAALFWADSTDESARHSLSVALDQMRRHINRDLFLTDRTTVQWNPDVPLWIDVDELRNWRQAPQESDSRLRDRIALYRGELLADMYDDWILRERERLRNTYLDALDALVEMLRARSDYAGAIEFALRVLQTDTANERAHQHLMFCYAMLGEREKAFDQYDACVRSLEEELGVAPSDETKTLLSWIRQTPAAPRLAARPTNLPTRLTSFIGRAQELQEVNARLAQARLVTLTGAGGSGKTRLALQAGVAALDRFRNGVWWVDLAPLNRGTLVAETILRALGLDAKSSQAPLEILCDELRPRACLIILDNCEHLLDACAEASETLLTACPELVILTSSREPLNVIGEMVYLVPTLTFPSPKRTPQVELLGQYEAVRLFVERAQAVHAPFVLNDTNAAAVAQICARLDGIPLALELAAACMRTLSAAEIAARLDDRFALLTHGARTALPRQQTLHALIEWSYNLLTRAERDLFQRLSVFVGGFTLQAVEFIFGDEPSPTAVPFLSPSPSTPVLPALPLLHRLVEKSLVSVVTQQGTTRYTLLETVREFARDQLRAAGHEAETRSRHANYWYAIALQFEQDMRNGFDWEWMRRLDIEVDNMRAAEAWLLEQAKKPNASVEDFEKPIHMIEAQILFWYEHGHYVEMEEWLSQLPERSDLPPRARARHILFRTWMQRQRGEWELMLDESRVGFALLQPEDDPFLFIRVVEQLATAERDVGDLESAIGHFIAWQNAAIQFGDTMSRYRCALMLAEAYLMRGELEPARPLLEQAIVWFRQRNDLNYLAWGLEALGNVARLQGALDEAAALYHESTRIKTELGDRFGLPFSFSALAQLAAERQQPERAARLWGAADKFKREVVYVMAPTQVLLYESHIPDARATLGEAAFQAEWALGQMLSLEQASEFAMQTPTEP